ncbi:hypothetical protein BSPWISOXPB_4448 [uncultured Gammaproteobacteria bacterium]|nr:hypothetical protein BSPWISOXPB_4448 [uncultured Gammaproteobacteria bacterium]
MGYRRTWDNGSIHEECSYGETRFVKNDGKALQLFLALRGKRNEKSIKFILLFALNSVCVAEIMEDYRIACKNTDGKN